MRDRVAKRRMGLSSRLVGLVLCVSGFAMGMAGGAARAQPFTAWLRSTPGYPTTSGFIQIPHSAALNPTGAFTIEAWVSISNNVSGEDCRSIAGKNYLGAWWIGQCNDLSGNPTLRSYLKGGGSRKDGGIIPRGPWTHVAVVFNGTHRLHYINGELAASFVETGPLTVSGDPVRIFSDVSWPRSPNGAIDEVRLWNVARSIGQIRANLNKRITTAQPGLVGVWSLDGSANDIISTHDGATMGTGLGFFTFAVAASCAGPTATTLCLQSRFVVSAQWRTNPTPGTPPDGNAQVVTSDIGSGIFWFFSANNWEIMAKAINGCGLNNRYWFFSAATTNVFYRVTVTDVHGEQKIYFNYPGPPAPAVTDTDALATCP
jgi:concanavalin A-like lectin/glucanase superfamily protein